MPKTNTQCLGKKVQIRVIKKWQRKICFKICISKGDILDFGHSAQLSRSYPCGHLRHTFYTVQLLKDFTHSLCTKIEPTTHISVDYQIQLFNGQVLGDFPTLMGWEANSVGCYCYVSTATHTCTSMHAHPPILGMV